MKSFVVPEGAEQLNKWPQVMSLEKRFREYMLAKKKEVQFHSLPWQ